MNINVIFSSGGKYNKGSQQTLADKDTVTSAQKVGEALKTAGHTVDYLEVTPDKIGDVATISSDVVFNLCEWSGKDYVLGVKVIKQLKKMGIPYTGADDEAYTWGSEKQIMKQKFEQFDIPTSKWFVYEGGEIKLPDQLTFPLIVKPAWEHCSIGISQNSVVTNQVELNTKVSQHWRKYRQPILIEEFLPGNEYQVTVLEKGGKPYILPPAEITYKSNGFFPILSFESKWFESAADYDISDIHPISSIKRTREIKRICIAAFKNLGCKDYARFDLKEKDGQIKVLEVNVNPGLDWDPEYSMTISAESAGLDFSSLLNQILRSVVHPS